MSQCWVICSSAGEVYWGKHLQFASGKSAGERTGTNTSPPCLYGSFAGPILFHADLLKSGRILKCRLISSRCFFFPHPFLLPTEQHRHSSFWVFQRAAIQLWHTSNGFMKQSCQHKNRALNSSNCSLVNKHLCHMLVTEV